MGLMHIRSIRHGTKHTSEQAMTLRGRPHTLVDGRVHARLMQNRMPVTTASATQHSATTTCASENKPN